MKRMIIFLVLAFVLTTALFADTLQSEYSYVYVPLNKVYNHQNGYVALYSKDGLKISTAYLPMDWFSINVQKARLVNVPKGLAPYMIVYYKNDQFQYVTMAVPQDRTDDFWGVLKNTSNVSDKFNADTFTWN